MSDHPLYVAFLWHMHQPYYKNPISGEISMPWVRLHAIKDYLDMVQLLQDFPNLHQTFNVVPSLLEQLEDILNPDSQKDEFYNITLRDPKELEEDEKIFLLRNFFMANWETMIRPFPRYYDLLIKRGRHISPEEMPNALKRFTAQDYTDLQTLFNLAWLDPIYREKDPQLKELVKKGGYYSKNDKRLILDKQLEIIRHVIPTYKKMQNDGIIEISVSPFYHPILPLLCESDIAKVSSPEIKLPKASFHHPEDAKYQITEAVKFYTERFGRPPKGIWPPEGSVSEKVIDLAIEAGVDWIATDEDILFKSIEKQKTIETLYKPYLLQRKYGELAIIFRDKTLSDLIGFVYHSWAAEKAVEDFIKRLNSIRDLLSKSKNPYLVPIILDGENAWEFYTNDGRNFLTYLYRALSDNSKLKLVTVSEFLQEHPPQTKLEKLHPGSWIGANFALWIGHDEKNRAWDYLTEARNTLEAYQRGNPSESASEKIQKAWKEIYIAEGSDWNWWYGDDHTSANDEEFDKLFRTHISNVYRLLDKKPPESLVAPIKVKKAKIVRGPAALLKPVIDGVDTNYFEWINAGLVDSSKCGGTMHQSETIIKQVYFGFDMETLYLRFNLALLPEHTEKDGVRLNLFFMEQAIKITVPILGKKKEIEYTIFEKGQNDGWVEKKRCDTASFNKILEIAVTFDDINAKKGESLNMLTDIEHAGMVIERCPEYGPIHIVLPDLDYESTSWVV